MANFIINTAGTNAIRKTQVSLLEVVQNGEEGFDLNVYLTAIPAHSLVFETDTTLEGIQAKATTVIAALNE